MMMISVLSVLRVIVLLHFVYAAFARPSQGGRSSTLAAGAQDVAKRARGIESPIQIRRVKATRNYHERYDELAKKRSDGSLSRRGDVSGSIGLGNNADLLYTVPIQLGNTVTAVNIDTGSSDLWVITDDCTSRLCNASQATRYKSANLKRHPHASGTPSLASSSGGGADVLLQYGDSKTGTSASGPVGYDVATIAGVAMTDQAFAAVNDTNNALVRFGAAGIFGLGFPSGSKVQEAAVTKQFGPIRETDNFLVSTYTDGPLLTRIAMTNALQMPMFTISLQRSTIDIGGNNGLLTIGKLPDGIDNSSLTWVPVRLYTPQNGGLQPPSFAPNEVYPLRWEIEIDGVFLDGQKVPDSSIPSQGVNPGRVTALIDTGNSLLRGPQDMVTNILKTVSPSYDPNNADSKPIFPCRGPHTVAFQIGGKMFPVDPRDFIGQLTPGNVTECVADNIVSTDPPRFGSLYSWSLGDPFFKSTLVAFHYGNLTHPSVDPPRIGFLSTVPADASDQLVKSVQDAQKNGGNFEETLVVAPTASAAAQSRTTVSVSTLTPAPNLIEPSKTVTLSLGSPSSAAGAEKDQSTSDTRTSSGGMALAVVGAQTLRSWMRIFSLLIVLGAVF